MLCLSTLGKNVLNTKKPRTPVQVVQKTRSLLLYSSNSLDVGGTKMVKLNSLIREIKLILYGDNDCEPSEEACAQLTQEFFREDTLRLLIVFLPKLTLEARKDATQVVANLQRQPLPSRSHASRYLEANLDLVDCLISGYEDPQIALHYGRMLKECIRHQVVACYILEPEHLKKFFYYIQLPEFDVAADATDTFKDLLTRHKSTVSEFLLKHYDWFFTEYNENLLKSANYITRRQAVKLLGSILLERSNSGIMARYVSSKDNLMILMNLLRDSSKSIQIDAFHVFKLFVANEDAPAEIVNILVTNRSKLLRLLDGFEVDKEDELFHADKDLLVAKLSELELKD